MTVEFSETGNLKTITFDLADISIHYGNIAFELLREYQAYKLVEERLQMEKNFGAAYTLAHDKAVFVYGNREKCSYEYVRGMIASLVAYYTPT